MSTGTGTVEPKHELAHDEGGHVEVEDLKAKNIHGSEALVDPDLMNDAFQGETREHEMGLWESFKAHPKACIWAFIFCFTIVRYATHQMREGGQRRGTRADRDHPSPPK